MLCLTGTVFLKRFSCDSTSVTEWVKQVCVATNPATCSLDRTASHEECTPGSRVLGIHTHTVGTEPV